MNLHEIRDRTALASEVRGRYEVVSAENAERVAMIRERREEDRNTQVGLPTSGGVPLPPSARAEKRHDIKVPYAHFHTVNTTGRLVGELPQSHVVPRQENPEERERAEQIEKMLASTYYHSQGEVALQSVEWHNAIFGHGFLRVYWDYTSNMPRFSTVRPELFFPKFATSAGDEWDYAIYAAKRSAASVAAKYNVPVTELQEDDEELGGNRQFVTVLDYWDGKSHVIVAGSKVLRAEVNSFGFIPYVHFRNLGPQEYAWGLSDYEFYEGLAVYYNRLLSQHADIIELFSNPPIFAQRVGLAPDAILELFQRGGVIATNKEGATLDLLQGSGSPPEYQAQDNRVRELIDQLGFGKSGSGQPMSGTALMEMGASQDSLLKLKKSAWMPSQRLLNQRILQMIEKLGSGKLKFSGVLESGMRSLSFYMELDQGQSMPTREEVLEEASMYPATIGMSDEEILSKYGPGDVDYKKIIDGHYITRIIWNDRTAKQDPQFRLALLNEFQQGAKSLRSYLEETGVEDVDREVTRLMKEAEEMPWLRPQMAEYQRQQQEGMAGAASGGQLPGGAGMTPPDPMNAGQQMLNGSEGTSRRQGAVKGAPFGGQ